MVKEQLQHPPVGVGFVKSEEASHFEDLLHELPKADAVVAIGGAAAQDAAKFFSLHRRAQRIHIPTTVSNNAALTLFVGAQYQRRRHFIWGVPKPRAVIVDHDVIRKSLPRVNRAGIGELLCHYSGLYDWRLASRRGLGPTWDDALAEDVERMADQAAQMAPEIRQLTDQGIVTMIDIWVRMGFYFEERRPHNMFGGASEHVFTFNLGKVTGKRLFHAEAVGLGCVAMCYLQGNRPERVADAIVAAGARFKPESIGVTWEDVWVTLRTLKDYASGMRGEVPYSIIDEVEVERRPTFEALRDFIERYPGPPD
jgi:glycerol dehydrogenase-like iron-containing ADH family enzyme